MTTTKTILSVFITNLGKYNEGELIGEWLELPATADEIETVLKRIEINEEYEEFFITDFESDFCIPCGEYDNLDELNAQAEQIAKLNDYELNVISALLDDGYSITEALKKYDDVMVFPDCYTLADVAEQYAEETCLLDEIPEQLRYYFDFEAFGRDLSYDGNFIFFDGNCYVVWY